MSLIQTPLPEAPVKDRNIVKKLNPKQRLEALEWGKSQLQMCIQPRLMFEQAWYMQMAFYFGRHYLQWINGDASIMRLYEPPAPPYRVRAMVNRCRRIIRTEHTKITRQFPQFYVSPNTTDDEDRMGALAAQQIAEYLIREHKFNQRVSQAAFWQVICGTSFLKTYWDPSRIDPSGVQGSMCLDPVTAFHIYVPYLQEPELENQDFLIHTTLKDPSYIRWKWGINVEPNVEVQNGALEQRFFNALGIRNAQPTKNMVQVFEMWVKPCQKYPEGALLVWAGTEVIQLVDSWPYTKSEYPFAKLDHIPTGRFYGDSMLVDLIPLQKELNRSHSQIIEAKNRMAKPQWKAQRGSVDVSKMTSEPGLVVLWTPGFQPPEPVQPPQLPQYVVEERNTLASEMDDLAATGEITKGSVPPGVTAASAISYLQEENDNRFAPSVSSIEAAVEHIGKYMLSFVHDYWDESRTVKVVGDGHLQEARQFTKSDIRGNTDFCVEPGSAAPRSRAAKQAFILELVKMGMIDHTQALKYLEMVETNKLYDDAQIDSRQIVGEHVQMKQVMQKGVELFTAQPELAEQVPMDPETGEPDLSSMLMVPVNPWDNHVAHFEGHANWFKTQEFVNLDPTAKKLAVQHWELHKQSMFMQAQEQQLQAQALGMGQQPGQEEEGQGEPVSQRQGGNFQ